MNKEDKLKEIEHLLKQSKLYLNDIEEDLKAMEKDLLLMDKKKIKSSILH